MRDLTQDECRTLYVEGKCPLCGSTEYYRGPQGGLSENQTCAGCGAGFNVVLMHPEAAVGMGAQLIKEPDAVPAPEG